MLQQDIKAEIERLQRQLNDCRNKKKDAEDTLEEVEVFIDKTRAKRREIEDGLQETVSTIEKRLARLHPQSRFRERYLENAKAMIYNSKSSNALQNVSDAERKAMNKYYSLDDRISEYQMTIVSLENQISALRQQLV